MTTLVDAAHRFRAARKIADATYLDLIDAGEALATARNEYDRKQAETAHTAAKFAHERATADAKEARRIYSNLTAGLSASGGRGC